MVPKLCRCVTKNLDMLCIVSPKMLKNPALCHQNSYRCVTKTFIAGIVGSIPGRGNMFLPLFAWGVVPPPQCWGAELSIVWSHVTAELIVVLSPTPHLNAVHVATSPIFSSFLSFRKSYPSPPLEPSFHNICDIFGFFDPHPLSIWLHFKEYL